MTPLFHVKHSLLLTDPVVGLPNIDDELRGLLDWLCQLSGQEGWPTPFVTEFGRLRSEVVQIYAPIYEQEFREHGLSPAQAHAAAIARATSRFSWHCLPLWSEHEAGKCRAMDLRDSIYTPLQKAELIQAVREKYGARAEVLDHKLPGNAWHFHLAIKDPRGKPTNWR